jgi:hypothetical protein
MPSLLESMFRKTSSILRFARAAKFSVRAGMPRVLMPRSHVLRPCLRRRLRSRRRWRQAFGAAEPGPGPRLRNGLGKARQDRSDRRHGDRPFRRGDKARDPPASRRSGPISCRSRRRGARSSKRSWPSGSGRDGLPRSAFRRVLSGSSKRSRKSSPRSMKTLTMPCAARRSGGSGKTCSPR